MIFMFFKVYL